MISMHTALSYSWEHEGLVLINASSLFQNLVLLLEVELGKLSKNMDLMESHLIKSDRCLIMYFVT